MKVDKRGLEQVLRKVGLAQWNRFEFAVGDKLNDNILPILNVEGIGNIKVPVSIKVKQIIMFAFKTFHSEDVFQNLNHLKKASDVVNYYQNAGRKETGKGKKTTWQMNADNIIRHGVTENFFRQMVPSLLSDGLGKMGFDDDEVFQIDARPHIIFICERGSFSPLLQDFEEEQGTLIISVFYVSCHYRLCTCSNRNVGNNDGSNSRKKRI